MPPNRRSHGILVPGGAGWVNSAFGRQEKRQLLLAESHLTRRLFASMLAKIATLPSPAE